MKYVYQGYGLTLLMQGFPHFLEQCHLFQNYMYKPTRKRKFKLYTCSTSFDWAQVEADWLEVAIGKGNFDGGWLSS